MSRNHYLSQLILTAILALILSTGSAATLNSRSTSNAAPSLEWSELADSPGGFSVEFSTDGFATTLYSTKAASGEAIHAKSYSVSSALWAHLPQGTSLQWRVVSLAASGTPSATSAAGEVTVGSASNKSAKKPDAKTFDKKAKLDAAKPGDKELNDELIAEVPASRVAELLDDVKDVAFPVERLVSAQGRIILRLETAPGADLENAVVDGRKKIKGSLYDSNGKAARAPKSGDIVLQPNFLYHATLTPTDPFYASTPKYQYAPQQVHAPEAWSNSYTGNGVVVAVIDTGLNVSSPHQEFNGGGKILTGPDYVNSDNDPADDNGHGTNVAGIAVAEADGVGMVGIAPDAKVMPIKVLAASGSGASSDIGQAIDYAVANGAKVINMSLGGNVFGSLPGVSDVDLLRENCIRNAEDRGVVVVVAAGNDHASLPAVPASYTDAIYVAAVTPADRLTEFSNYGPWVTVAAPGYSMYSAANTGTTDYSYQSGTSQATPVVAGCAALLLQKDPALTPREVKEILQSTADDLGDVGRDDQYGFGRVNVAQALALTPTVATQPALVNVEFSTNKIIATFSRDMLHDGSVNAVNSGSVVFGGGSGELLTFLSGASFSAFDSTNFQLTLTNNTNLLTPGTVYLFGFNSNVIDTSGNAIFCDNTFPGTTRTNICGSSIPGTGAHQAYASAVAYANGTMKVLFNLPVTQASAQNSANYTLVSSPTNTSGGNTTGGSAVSLASATFSYNTTTRLLTIGNLPVGAMQTQGSTFALKLGSGIINADATANPLGTGFLEPIYGVVRSATGTAPVLTAVDNSALGNNLREVVRLTFNMPMASDSNMFTPSNYTVKVNGSTISNPSDMGIVYDAAKNEVLLNGFNFSGNSGQSLQVTVANLKTSDDGTVLIGANATSPLGTIDITGSDFGPSIENVVASPNSLFVQFSYYTKMNSTAVTTAGNWTLKSDAATTPTTTISLGSATFTYDSEQNSLRISGLSLTAGNRFSLVPSGLVIPKRYSTTFVLDNSTPFYDIVGSNGDFSPDIPGAASVAAGVNGGNHNSAGQINGSNASNVTVSVTPPSTALSGQKVYVTMLDSSSTPKTVSATATLVSSGATPINVSGLNASSFALGTVKVQAMLTNSTGTGSSDIFLGTATRDASLPVTVVGLELE